MKIRNGFVSNSSSSSFCIYGATIELTLTPEEEASDTDGDLLDTKMEELREKIDKSKHLVYHEDYDNNMFYVGRDFSSIGDDETGKQFKDGVAKAIEELTGEKKACEVIEETIAC